MNPLFSKKISDVYLPNRIETCLKSDTLRNAVKTMKDNFISSLSIIDENHKLVGIFTERDYIFKVAGKDIDLDKSTVGDFCTYDPYFYKMDDPMGKILLKMSLGNFRHAIIIDELLRPLSTVTQRDLIFFLIREVHSRLNEVLQVKIEEILPAPTVICCREKASLLEVVNKMCEHSIGGLVITDDDYNLKGIFTERDYMVKVAGNDLDLKNETVDAYMTPNPVYLKIEDYMIYALLLMNSVGRFRHLIIADDDNKPTGVISMRDIVKYLITYLN